jgi:glycosyltransferase involved in cell wall biosynthesis
LFRLDFALTSLPKILQLQSGRGASGGIAAYIASLVGSPALLNYAFIVTVGTSEAALLLKNSKYHASQIAENAETYGIRSIFAMLLSLKKLLHENDVDLVHSHALRAGFICAVLNSFFGVRYIYTNHGLRFQQKKGTLKRLIFRHLEKLVVRRAESVVCIRASDATLLKQIAPSQGHKIETISTRVSFSEDEHRAIDDEPNQLPVLIGVGSLINVKRVDRFIDWLAALSKAGIEYEALWLGDGPLRGDTEQYAAVSNVTVNWRGQVAPATVAAELKRASLLLLTSEFEVLSLAALEAMSQSTPIVTTDFFGVSDFIVNKQNGLVFSSEAESIDVATSICALLKDGPRLERMGQIARSFFDVQFADSNKMAYEYADLYRRQLEKNK